MSKGEGKKGDRERKSLIHGFIYIAPGLEATRKIIFKCDLNGFTFLYVLYVCTCEGILLSVCICTFMLQNILRQKKASRSLFSPFTMYELKTEFRFSCLHRLTCLSSPPLFNFYLESHLVMIGNTRLQKWQLI